MKVFCHPVTVGEADLDELGHANNIGYLRWLQDAAVAHSRAVGLGYERYVELGGVFVVRRHEIDYLRPALRGDRLEVRTFVGTVMAAKSERRYDIVRLQDEAVLARAVTIWGFVDVTSGRPMRIPDEVYDAFGFERRKKRTPTSQTP
jgi:acyl-CoA thioester hydrolase